MPLKYAPKRVGVSEYEHFTLCSLTHLKSSESDGFFSGYFTFERNELLAYLARTLVAVIDHNNNSNHKPSLSSTGDLKYQKVYSKRSKN